ncbi:MAG TPA: M1 family metallopeptidase, partial [Chitinophagales bacterium]|nr:M1 family metallopeptidase [Chitinophagales bacterium]
MQLRLLALLFFPLILISSCGTPHKTQQEDFTHELGEVVVKPESEYRPSATRINDLLHTQLHVHFDWQKQWLYGTATLTLKPYVKPVSELELDAKGFDINRVGKLENGNFTELPFQYDSLVLTIDLLKTYTDKDTCRIQIEYIAKPNELPDGGSDAITSDKGLYFINPLGKEKNKPIQIWTQGETEASSCWFPTIDKPNERTTQEIYITVPDTFVTLSNGLLVSSEKNPDGTRTDYWEMDLPHAPYLFMMAIGDFAVVRDKWRGKPVDYYVEKPYEPYARDIFGNTPEMLDFYSDLLGVDYPWQKYAQVVVRDYVSGAMENTTATVHFENMQRTKRELIDRDYEDIIAHELFHQWFGDYVTCESWANLTLNEGFATYGEYLWIEHKYGADMAERHRADMLHQYLSESWLYKEPVVRFHYHDKEDMFDSHSYAKGGLALHMLRTYLGDEIFFRALNIYLKEHAFQSVEIHQLRLAFEEASGEDLNWFFNQWFLSPGHPKLSLEYDYKPEEAIIAVTIRQTQDEDVFRLPMTIDIYFGDMVRRENVVMKKREQTFEFFIDSQPHLVNVDADKNLLCEWLDTKDPAALAFQYNHAQGYLNKRQALQMLSNSQQDSLAKATLIRALKDTFWGLRKLAVEKLLLDDKTKPLIAEAALNDEKPQVRAAAVARLGETKEEAYLDLYKKLLADSSLQVVANSLNSIYEINKEEALKLAPQFEEFNTTSIVSAIGAIYSQAGSDDK